MAGGCCCADISWDKYMAFLDVLKSKAVQCCGISGDFCAKIIDPILKLIFF
jgi:hypothetical protein